MPASASVRPCCPGSPCRPRRAHRHGRPFRPPQQHPADGGHRRQAERRGRGTADGRAVGDEHDGDEKAAEGPPAHHVTRGVGAALTAANRRRHGATLRGPALPCAPGGRRRRPRPRPRRCPSVAAPRRRDRRRRGGGAGGRSYGHGSSLGGGGRGPNTNEKRNLPVTAVTAASQPPAPKPVWDSRHCHTERARACSLERRENAVSRAAGSGQGRSVAVPLGYGVGKMIPGHSSTANRRPPMRI